MSCENNKHKGSFFRDANEEWSCMSCNEFVDISEINGEASNIRKENDMPEAFGDFVLVEKVEKEQSGFTIEETFETAEVHSVGTSEACSKLNGMLFDNSLVVFDQGMAVKFGLDTNLLIIKVSDIVAIVSKEEVNGEK